MAIRQIAYSDISNEAIEDDQHARLVIQHPDYPDRREIDVSTAEADKLQMTSLRLVTLTVLVPNKPPREVTVESKVLDKLFDGVPDFTKVLDGARRSQSAATPPSQRTPRVTTAKSPASGEKRDYSSPEWAGVEHRGRTTDVEAKWVRDNLEKANANRAREGQEPIDPALDKYVKRYKF